MAQFERVRHLAEQMGILTAIGDRLRTAREALVAEPPPV
jgi:hypothetical protein